MVPPHRACGTEAHLAQTPSTFVSTTPPTDGQNEILKTHVLCSCFFLSQRPTLKIYILALSLLDFPSPSPAPNFLFLITTHINIELFNKKDYTTFLKNFRYICRHIHTYTYIYIATLKIKYIYSNIFILYLFCKKLGKKGRKRERNFSFFSFSYKCYYFYAL